MKNKTLETERETNLDGVLRWETPADILRPGATAKHPGIDRCLDFMIEKFSEPIQMKHLVKVSGMSRRGFCKAFSKTVGINPGAALRGMRIEYAKRILIEHDFVLKRIARQCGYRSENTFCVAFQRVVGIPPKKFQRQYWLEVYRNRGQRKIQPVIASRPVPPALDGNLPVRFDKSNHNLKGLLASQRIA